MADEKKAEVAQERKPDDVAARKAAPEDQKRAGAEAAKKADEPRGSEQARKAQQDEPSKAGIAEQTALREITIMLDTYDDIFSDFDPRPYQKRALSEDFLKEMQRRYLEDKRGRFEVSFTIPAAERDIAAENLIKRRLREHFAFMSRREQDAITYIKRRGYAYIIVGAVVLLANVYSLAVLNESNLFYQILSVILVPAGWYGMWTGIGKVVDEPSEAVNRKALSEKFEKANYIFLSAEEE